MPLHRRSRRRRSRTTLASTDSFEVSVSGQIPLEGVPAKYLEEFKRQLAKEMRRRHIQEVIKRLTKGENSETYDKIYAARKTKRFRNVRGLGNGPSTFTQSGPVTYNDSGALMNSLQQVVQIKGDSVVSSIVAPPGRHPNGMKFSDLVRELDETKNLKANALKAMKEGRAKIVTGPILKAAAKTSQRLSGQSLGRSPDRFF